MLDCSGCVTGPQALTITRANLDGSRLFSSAELHPSIVYLLRRFLGFVTIGRTAEVFTSLRWPKQVTVGIVGVKAPSPTPAASFTVGQTVTGRAEQIGHSVLCRITKVVGAKKQPTLQSKKSKCMGRGDSIGLLRRISPSSIVEKMPSGNFEAQWPESTLSALPALPWVTLTSITGWRLY